MKIIQMKLSKMALFSYLVMDEASRTAALIDPAFDSEKILLKISESGFRITHLINTHGHPDHTAGNAAILSATQGALCVHRLDAVRFKGILHKAFSRFLGGKGSPMPDLFLEADEEIVVGATRLSILHTPGHTPGGISIYTEGHVFTGDTLFVGGVGRTDLPGGAHQTLLASIHEKIYSLPDDTIVWPGHDYGHTPHSTVGEEKRTNPFTRS